MGEPSRLDSLPTLGKYTLIEKISDGYLGPVYRGFDQHLDRAVDVRILSGDIKWEEELEALFRKECDPVARLQHPNVASLFEASTRERVPFIAMEPLGNRDLQKLIARKNEISFETKISVMIQAAEGLGYAHSQGILHRNLCPENIFMTGDGCIKIRDFSIAHVLMKHLPHPGVRWGAPIYLSPEEIQHKQSSARSDIFALGVIYYELLTGIHPFYAPDGNKALDNILQDKQPPTFERYPDLHPRIWRILKTCLAKNPEDRYGNVDELLEAFRGLLKDMAEDVQLMLSELQSSFALLKIAAKKPGASGPVIRLYGTVQNLLRGVEKADYSQLDRLITQLLEVYPEISKAATDQNIFDSLLHPAFRSEELRIPEAEIAFLKEAAVSDAPMETAKEETLSPGNPAAPGPDRHETLPKPDPSGEIDAGAARETFPGAPLVEKTSREAAANAIRPENVSDQPRNEAAEDEEAPLNRTAEQDADGAAALQEPSDPVRAYTIRYAFNRRKFKRVLRSASRVAAVTVAVLLLAVAVHSFQKSGAGDTLRGALKNFVLDPLKTAKASILKKAQPGIDPGAPVESAPIFEELDGSQYETELIEELNESSFVESPTTPPQDGLDRIAVMIGAGKLEQAQAELDRLRRLYPDSPEVGELYGKWRDEASRTAEKERREQQMREAADKEESWEAQFRSSFSQGRYQEAENVAALWTGDLPQSAAARESAAAVDEIQARIAACMAAMNDGRYGAALQELDAAEQVNPSDPGMAALRREIKSRSGSAAATLTVYRLGDGATLVLDGKRIGNDGEAVSQSIPAGNHEISVEKDGRLLATRSQELFEGQAIALVYDIAQKNIRPMIESDRILIERRKTMEEVHRFAAEHPHGILRGKCRGDLILSFNEVVYKPVAGSHGFRIPFKLLMPEQDGRTVDLFFISDNEHFKKFEFDDEQSAAKFIRTWDMLKSLQ